ncbi:hypothetical protein MSTE_02506 [Mycobacteroides stephanolepidis]|uniref:Polyketide cyclase n=1 Tax=[Mycobacterium] stephanolepidis TaxID=1520670 RepID=A0A1Z4EXX0_9MYCO|nr:SRPBCC family protein [[Mycobacterium] stephanolepidis]BAX97816.1 hypothetical protein MSTE_02506 [[Mycobacterium] stephanolepidis]
MQTLEVRRTYAASITETFDWFSNAHNYTAAPFFRSCRLIQPGREAAFGSGAVRQLRFPFGIVQEEITQFDPPFSFQYRVVKSVPPVNHDGGEVALRETGAGTELVWTSTAELRLPVLAVPLTRIIFPALFGRAFTQVLDAAEMALAVKLPA